MSWLTWRLFTAAHALFVSRVVSAATWLVFTGACAVCGMCVVVVVLSPLAPPPFACVLYICFFQIEKGARAHCRHRHGQLMQW